MDRMMYRAQRQAERRARRMQARVLRVLMRRSLSVLGQWMRRRQQARERAAGLQQLRQLSDRMLRDVGLLRGDLQRWG